LDWEKVFKLEPAEHVEAYVEDLSRPDRWWNCALSFDSILHLKTPK
jgi:hypothetical protein